MKQEILKLRAEGKTYDQIQVLLNCSKGTIAYHCGEGQKEKYRENNQRRQKKNRQWLEDIKNKLFCEICKESRYWILDFHHTDPNEKEGSVSRLIRSVSKDRVLEEIKKCQVLCANCHRDLHHKLNNKA